MIFASELSKCRKVKFLFGFLASIFGFIVFVVFPLYFLLKEPDKTLRDYVLEYLYYRMNFTPDTVKNAYYNPLQYIYPLYDEVVKEEIEFIRSKKVYQIFVLQGLTEEKKPEYYFKAYGILTRISCLNTCKVMLNRKLKIRIKPVNKKFTLEVIE